MKKNCFCLPCMTATVGFDENKFAQVRNPGTWIWLHCRLECAEKTRCSEPLSCAVAVAANNCHEEVYGLFGALKAPAAYNRSPVEKNIFRCRGDAVYET
jgi:hypothetical protein